MVRAPRLALALLTLPALVAAQPLDGAANLNFHHTQASYAGCDDGLWDEIDGGVCADLDLDPIPAQSFLWFVISRVDVPLENGVGGVQLGIDHVDADVLGWTLCTGGSEIPEDGWPASGTGNAMTWSAGCYEPAGGHQARIGFITLGDGLVGQFEVTGDPRVGQAVYADCDTETYAICFSNLGRYDTGLDFNPPTCNPECGSVPSRRSSWGTLKALF